MIIKIYNQIYIFYNQSIYIDVEVWPHKIRTQFEGKEVFLDKVMICFSFWTLNCLLNIWLTYLAYLASNTNNCMTYVIFEVTVLKLFYLLKQRYYDNLP